MSRSGSVATGMPVALNMMLSVPQCFSSAGLKERQPPAPVKGAIMARNVGKPHRNAMAMAFSYLA